jgi:hypothetical protein
MSGILPAQALKRSYAELSWLLLLLLVAVVTARAQNVLTWHNDNARTGQNLKETQLQPSNVNSTTFGLRFVLTADGSVDAQPLYMADVKIPGPGGEVRHNVLFVATEHDSVYAFDADTGARLWQVSMLESGESPSDDRGCNSISPEIGVTATPVIVPISGPHGTIYIVAMSKDGSGNYYQRLHALDITSGKEEFGGPVEIQAKFPGTGDNSLNGYVLFDPGQYMDRPGLLVVGQNVYTAWSSHCDVRPYTGWVIGYNISTLAQSHVLDVTPNGNQGAIWSSGAGMAADDSGYIYFLDSNGTFDTQLDARGFPAQGDFGNGFLKLNPELKVVDYFDMYNTVRESDIDDDLGSGGALVVPPMKDADGKTRYLVVGAGKDTIIYLADRTNMGKFNPNNNSNIYQEVTQVGQVEGLGDGVWGAPAFFNHTLYYGAQSDVIRAFRFSNAMLLSTPVSTTSIPFEYPGATPSISAAGDSDGILWASENINPGVLHAYDARDLSVELYNSNQAGSRDHFGNGNKFITPTIAGGKVYVATTSGVGVFGLLRNSTESEKLPPTRK